MDDQVVMNFKNYRSRLSREKTEILEDVESGTLTTQVRNFVYWLRSSNADDELFSYILLVSALRREHISTSKFLIEKGCSVRLPQKTGHFCTPLYYALKMKNWRICLELSKRGASLFDCDANIDTALELAMNIGARWFIEKALDNICSTKKNTSLDSACEDHILLFHAACWVKHPEAVRTFLSHGFSMKSRSKFNTEDWKGFTPLHFATCGYPERPYYSLQSPFPYQDRGKMIPMLLEHDDTDVFAQDKQGRTPFHVSFKGIFQFDRHFILKHESQFKDRSYVNPEDGNGSGIFLMSCCLMTAYEEDAKKLRNLIEYLIENKVDLNCSVPVEDERYPGWTALHFATRGSFWTLMKLLLKHGADASILDESGDGPLNVVCRKSICRSDLSENKPQQCLELIQLLLENGADPNVKICQDRTAVHELFRAHRLGRSPIYLLHESEMMLLSKNRNGINHTDRFGISYLHVACLGDDLEIIKTLVKNGASVNSQIKSNAIWYPGYSPLHFAVESSRFEFVEYLVSQGADINVVNKDGDTPLHLACDNFRAVKYNRKYELLDANDDYEWQPSRLQHIRIIEYLIQHGAVVDAKNSRGLTPLMKNFYCPRIIPHTIFGDQNKKFHESIKNELFIRQKRVMDILLRHGADINVCCTDEWSKYEGSVLHILLCYYSSCPFDEVLVELVLKKGADVNAVNREGSTPLHIAAEFSRDGDVRVSMITLLIKYGANINAKSRRFGTPLHTILDNGDLNPEKEAIATKLLNLLLDDVNAQDILKETLLRKAIDRRKFWYTSKLLEAGADINVEDSEGNPPTNAFSKVLLQNRAPNDQQIKLLVVIITHVKKLEKLKLYVSEKVMHDCQIFSIFLPKQTLDSMDSDIDKDVNYLKSQKVCSNISLYDILFKDCHAMATLVLNTQLQEAIKSIQVGSKFPHFENIIKRQYEKGLKRLKLLEPAKNALKLVTRINWPDSCSGEILSNFCDEDLKDFVQASSQYESRKRPKICPANRKPSAKKSRRYK